MIEPNEFFNQLKRLGIEFYTGVPDSLLKSFCAYISDNVSSEHHIISANEGAAIGLAIGHHLATGKIPVVYMQNSGLGNVINPLMSLADKEVYDIPMLLLIGWRGEPGVKDEPQHVKQGRVMLSTLDAMEIPYAIIDADVSSVETALEKAREHFRQHSSPMAFVVRKGAFNAYSLASPKASNYELSREQAISILLEKFTDETIVATTGMASRELFELREARGEDHSRDFLTVGGMGHASQIALGIALSSQKNVVCIDGDGAAIMHLGSMAINGTSKAKNFKHIILNNGAHDSVGGQDTAAFSIELTQVAQACGYVNQFVATDQKTLRSQIDVFLKSDGPSVFEIRVKKGNRTDLGRPTVTPKENKSNFMKMLCDKSTLG